jgi:predicted MFS family arabinose efflux permease
MTFGAFLIVALLATIAILLAVRLPKPQREGPAPKSVIFRGWHDRQLWLTLALIALVAVLALVAA